MIHVKMNAAQLTDIEANVLTDVLYMTHAEFKMIYYAMKFASYGLHESKGVHQIEKAVDNFLEALEWRVNDE